jgi:hypothetical protein
MGPFAREPRCAGLVLYGAQLHPDEGPSWDASLTKKIGPKRSHRIGRSTVLRALTNALNPGTSPNSRGY